MCWSSIVSLETEMMDGTISSRILSKEILISTYFPVCLPERKAVLFNEKLVVLATHSVFFLEPPDGDLSAVTAGSQESRFLWVPGDTVDILVMSFGHLSSQREHRLIWISCLILLKHSHCIVTAGSCQGASQSTPEHRLTELSWVWFEKVTNLDIYKPVKSVEKSASEFSRWNHVMRSTKETSYWKKIILTLPLCDKCRKRCLRYNFVNI